MKDVPKRPLSRIFPRMDAIKSETWRDRLEAAVAKDGRSQRKISLAAGQGHGYVNSLLREGKDPTVDNIASVCDELGVSLTWLLLGVEMSQETEKILRLLEARPGSRKGILQILQDEGTPRSS